MSVITIIHVYTSVIRPSTECESILREVLNKGVWLRGWMIKSYKCYISHVRGIVAKPSGLLDHTQSPLCRKCLGFYFIMAVHESCRRYNISKTVPASCKNCWLSAPPPKALRNAKGDYK